MSPETCHFYVVPDCHPHASDLPRPAAAARRSTCTSARSARKILTLGRQGDYFAFLGVPRKLNLDAADLEQRFRALSRQFHPDYFYNATPAERRASLERSSYLNDAYRTLQAADRAHRVSARARRACWRRPTRRGQRRPKQVPPALLEEVFALNEELDEVRELRASGAPAERVEGAAGARAAADRGEARRARGSSCRTLSAQWDALVDCGADDAERARVLDALRERMLERNYINNLLAGIERELTRERQTRGSRTRVRT